MKKLLSLAIMVTLSLVLGGGIALAGDTIKLGGPMPLTGPYAGDGVEMKMAMELAIDDINAMGGVMGKKVEGVYGDVQDLSVEAAVSVYEMLRKAGVQAVISGYSCATTAPLEFWGPTRIPFIEASVRDSYAEMVKSDPKKYANVFQNSQIASDMGIDTGLFLFDIPKKMGWKPPNKKVAIVAFEDPSYAEPAARFQEMAEKYGYQTVIKNLYQFGYGSDWRAVLTKIDAERPAFITIFTILPADAANFTMQFNEYFGDDYNGLLYFLFAPAMPEYLEWRVKRQKKSFSIPCPSSSSVMKSKNWTKSGSPNSKSPATAIPRYTYMTP